MIWEALLFQAHAKYGTWSIDFDQYTLTKVYLFFAEILSKHFWLQKIL